MVGSVSVCATLPVTPSAMARRRLKPLAACRQLKVGSWVTVRQGAPPGRKKRDQRQVGSKARQKGSARKRARLVRQTAAFLIEYHRAAPKATVLYPNHLALLCSDFKCDEPWKTAQLAVGQLKAIKEVKHIKVLEKALVQAVREGNSRDRPMAGTPTLWHHSPQARSPGKRSCVSSGARSLTIVDVEGVMKGTSRGICSEQVQCPIDQLRAGLEALGFERQEVAQGLQRLDNEKAILLLNGMAFMAA